MCEYPCVTPEPEIKFRKLTLVLLDCWQREYDKRPYRSFQFQRLMFEERFNRNFDPQQDFPIIVQFLKERSLCSVKLVGFRVLFSDYSIIEDFVKALQKFKSVELKLMELPSHFFKIMAQNVKRMRIKELSLEGTPLHNRDIAYLYLFLIYSKTLQYLNISSCQINQYNFAPLADGIYKSQSLKSCNISHIIGLHLTLDSEKIAHTLASLIWQNKLQQLELENCGLIGHDMETIAEYLSNKSSKLLTLNVAFNNIGANGALEVFKAISMSKTLKVLNLNGCNLATHGGEIVSQFLSSCGNLESLKLQYNKITAEAINMILLSWKKSCNIKKLLLFGNRFNPRTGNILRRLLESGVLPQDCIDITFTYDDTIPAYRVVPWFG
ncbi:NACHT, LRR and PYD domains-containing protein 9C [Cochliomyia hominivorax]